MPAQIDWLDRPRIIRVSYSGHVNVDDARTIIAFCVTALANGPVYFLVDFSEIVSFDSQIIELSSFSEWLYHPNARWFAYVRLTGLYKNLLQMRHQNNMKLYQERAEAEHFLRGAAQIL
jgi:hypothetical protein